MNIVYHKTDYNTSYLRDTTLVNDPMNDYLTHRSIKIKADVVRVDPWEKDLRASLNYGHTIGHALELLTSLRHGIAVALGIRCENRIADKLGIMNKDIMKKIDCDLDKLGFEIPREMPKFKKLVPYILQDKKNISGKIKLALIDGIKELKFSNCDPRITVDLDVIEQAYKEFCQEHEIKEVERCKIRM